MNSIHLQPPHSEMYHFHMVIRTEPRNSMAICANVPDSLDRVRYEALYFGFVFHSPASLTPCETEATPLSTPVPMLAMPSPRGLPRPPVAPVTVSPMPREAAPTTPPTVFVRPPTVLPRVEVTVFPAPVTPELFFLLFIVTLVGVFGFDVSQVGS